MDPDDLPDHLMEYPQFRSGPRLPLWPRPVGGADATYIHTHDEGLLRGGLAEASFRGAPHGNVAQHGVQSGHPEDSLSVRSRDFSPTLMALQNAPEPSSLSSDLSGQHPLFFPGIHHSLPGQEPDLGPVNTHHWYPTYCDQGSMAPAPMVNVFQRAPAPDATRLSMINRLDPTSSLDVSASSSRSPSAERRMPPDSNPGLLQRSSSHRQPRSSRANIHGRLNSPQRGGECLTGLQIPGSHASLRPMPVRPELSLSPPGDTTSICYDYSITTSPNPSIFTYSDGAPSSLSDADLWDLPMSSSQGVSSVQNAMSDYAKSEVDPLAAPAVSSSLKDQYLKISNGSLPSRRKSEPAPFQPGRRSRSPMLLTSSLSARMRKHSDAKDTQDASLDMAVPQFSSADLPSGPQRGRRSGPLTEETRMHVRKMRSEKLTCIRCKMRKVRCNPTNDFEGCTACLVKINPSDKQQLACAKASFMNLVLQGSLNYVAQRSINHLRKDRLTRCRLPVPEMIDFPKLVTLIRKISEEHKVRVSQGSVKLYDLKLDACASYLSIISSGIPEISSFRYLIDTHLQKDNGWIDCVEDGGHLKDPVAVLSIWNNMPSRVTYSLLGRNGGCQRILDPEDAFDQNLIYAAAQLSRIVARKLELSAYSQLENMLLGGNSSQTVLALLANQLLSLRWRISWWTVIGSGIPPQPSVLGLIYDDHIESAERTRAIARTTEICKSLYVYYCFIRRQTGDINQIPKRKKSKYADTLNEVEETLPSDDTADGFTRWMAEGCKKVEESRASEQLRRVGLA